MGPFGAIGSIQRMARAGWVLAREGVFAGVDPTLPPPEARPLLALGKLLARRDRGPGALTRAISRLGPNYVKLGQFLATRPDVVGVAAVQELEALQDRMAPFPRADAVATIENSFGRPLGEVFVSFGEPVAAASIAQVHPATVRDPDGSERKVAVKVLRPGVARRFRRDLDDMFFAARFAERRFPEARRLRLVEVVETLARSVKIEMDFRLEAAASSEFAENVADDPDFIVPNVDWDRTVADVMTTDWVDGAPLSDPQALRALGVDLPELGRTVLKSFLRHALRDGFFHADMHQGNLFADAQGRLIAVDFGITGRLGLKERRFLAEILYGFIVRDYMRVARAHFDAGYVPKTHRVEDFAQATRAIGEPIHARTADQISMAKLLTLLFEITALFDMKTRTELVMLQKTMVVAEGVARKLDPHLDMWTVSEPIVRDYVESYVGPRGVLADAGRNLEVLARSARELPEMMARFDRMTTPWADPASAEATPWRASAGEPARAMSRAATLGLWAIAGALIWLGYVLK
jgi:ubiquinone biosynthesis protein